MDTRTFSERLNRPKRKHGTRGASRVFMSAPPFHNRRRETGPGSRFCEMFHAESRVTSAMFG